MWMIWDLKKNDRYSDSMFGSEDEAVQRLIANGHTHDLEHYLIGRRRRRVADSVVIDAVYRHPG